MEIKKEFPHINFLEKEPMSRHTTFRIGGPAGLFASVQVAGCGAIGIVLQDP